MLYLSIYISRKLLPFLSTFLYIKISFVAFFSIYVLFCIFWIFFMSQIIWYCKASYFICKEKKFNSAKYWLSNFTLEIPFRLLFSSFFLFHLSSSLMTLLNKLNLFKQILSCCFKRCTQKHTHHPRIVEIQPTFDW